MYIYIYMYRLSKGAIYMRIYAMATYIACIFLLRVCACIYSQQQHAWRMRNSAITLYTYVRYRVYYTTMPLCMHDAMLLCMLRPYIYAACIYISRAYMCARAHTRIVSSYVCYVPSLCQLARVYIYISYSVAMICAEMICVYDTYIYYYY